MSVTVITELKAKPERIDDLIALLKVLLPESLAHEGCEKITIQQSQDDSCDIISNQIWNSRKDYESYVHWRTENGVTAQFNELLSEPIQMTYYDEVRFPVVTPENLKCEVPTVSKYTMDPEIQQALLDFAKKIGTPERPARGDWRKLREIGNTNLDLWAKEAPSFPDVKGHSFFVKTKGGVSIELRWYTKTGESTGAAVVYAHGGGMVLGDLDKYDAVISEYVSRTSTPFLSVKYRLAPESKGENLAEDVFAGLKWLVENSHDLKVERKRISVMGDSAGGGIAAGVAILARERGIPVAMQILIYPMLDDRNTINNAELMPFLTWTYDGNFTGWSAVLGYDIGTDRVTPIIAPARLKNFQGLASAYIEVGDLDIFRDECIKYAERLSGAGIPIELHVLPGAPHGFERFDPNSNLARRAMDNRIRVIKSL